MSMGGCGRLTQHGGKINGRSASGQWSTIDKVRKAQLKVDFSKLPLLLLLEPAGQLPGWLGASKLTPGGSELSDKE